MRVLWQQDNDSAAISEAMNCDIRTVQRYIRRFQEEGEGGEIVQDRRNNNVGQRKISDAVLQEVVAAMRQDPFRAVKHLPEILNLDVHEHTLRRAIKSRTNISFRKASVKVQLQPADMLARLNYANTHLHITEADWRTSIAMDEKVFSTCKDGKLVYTALSCISL